MMALQNGPQTPSMKPFIVYWLVQVQGSVTVHSKALFELMKLPAERQIAAIFYPKQTDMDAKPQLSVKMSEGRGVSQWPL
jgi:hypothetical protein